MNELIAIERIAQWDKLKSLVLDSVSSPITKRVYNMALHDLVLSRPHCPLNLSLDRKFPVPHRPETASWDFRGLRPDDARLGESF